MTEGTPIQDSSILNSVPTPEAQRDNFGIQNFYSSESLYMLFTRDYKSHHIHFENNWGEIREEQYDPISSISADIACNLKYLFDKNTKDRNEKVIHMSGTVSTMGWNFLRNKFDTIPAVRTALGVGPDEIMDWNSREWLNKVYERDFGPEKYSISKYHDELYNQFVLLWQKEFSTLGLDFKQNNEDQFGRVLRRGVEFSTTNTTHPVSLKLYGYFGRILTGSDSEDENCFHITLPFPQSTILLSCPEDVEGLQRNFFTDLKKIIKGIYKVQEKTLPPAKLEFKPQQHFSSEFMASCSYCGRNYFTAQDLTCPGCGGSSPKFIVKE